MKLNKTTLKDLIYEILLEEEAPAASARVQAAGKAVATGSMREEEYAQLLKQTLLAPNVTPQVRLKSLEALFPGKGRVVNDLIAKLKGEVAPTETPETAAPAATAATPVSPGAHPAKVGPWGGQEEGRRRPKRVLKRGK